MPIQLRQQIPIFIVGLRCKLDRLCTHAVTNKAPNPTGIKKGTEMLQKRGFTPKLQRLDNEASKMLQDFMEEQGVTFQLTPAGLHRINNANRAIHTSKNHFIAGLSSTPPHFPLNLWDTLSPQALLTLNLMIPARVNPQLSAYAHAHVAFDYRKKLITPPGIIFYHMYDRNYANHGIRTQKKHSTWDYPWALPLPQHLDSYNSINAHMR